MGACACVHTCVWGGGGCLLVSVHLSLTSQEVSFGLSSLNDHFLFFFHRLSWEWVTLHHFIFHAWQSCLSNLPSFTLGWFCLEGVCLVRVLRLFFLFTFFLSTIFKPCRPGFIKKQVAASGYPVPEVLLVLKNPSTKMVIDMKPGGLTGLTTCSINTFHWCATKGLDLAEGVTVCPYINLGRKHTLETYYWWRSTGHRTSLHTFELEHLGARSCNLKNQASDSHHRVKTAHALIQGVLSVPEKPSLTR